MINNVNKLAANFWSIKDKANAKKQAQTFELPPDNEPIVLKQGSLVTSSFRIPGGGVITASVYKSENFSPQNPVMLVRGSGFEKEVNINDIDPSNASFVELLAFDGYMATMGKPSQTARIAARGLLMEELNGKEFLDFKTFTKMDFAKTLRDFMESLHSTQNYEPLMWVNSNVENFFGHFEK